LQQLCKNPVENISDIHAECSNIHLFAASQCHLQAVCNIHAMKLLVRKKFIIGITLLGLDLQYSLSAIG